MPLILDNGMNGSMNGALSGAMNGAINGAMNGAINVDLGDVDDLFGDPLPLAISTRPPSKRLLQRVDDLRGRGCCQGIAWSKSGTIASITADGKGIELRFLRSNHHDGSWGLSEPTPCPLFDGPSAGGPIVHLAWASTSSPELAVIDAVGRVSILQFAINLNKPVQFRRWDADPVDDLQAVVGCYWLPLMPQNRQQFYIQHGPAVRESEEAYKYETTFVQAFGPWHPNPAKTALVCVTANGVFKLFYSQNNQKQEEATLELESITSSDDLVTHASICSDMKQTLLLCLATASRQLMVIRVKVDWGVPQDKQVPPASNILHPVFRQEKVAVTSWFQHGPSESHLDPAMSLLTHLEILPSIVDNPRQDWPASSPAILAVRTHVPSPGSSYPQEVQSIIDRWDILNDQPQRLHPAFEQLSNRRNSVGSSPSTATRLRKLDPIILNKVIVEIHTIHFGKIICITFSDGTVQYRDRLTMSEMNNDINLNSIATLHHVGFQFPDEGPCLQVAFSPTNCSFVQLCDDGKIKWNYLRSALSGVDSSEQEAQYTATVAGLTIAISGATYQQVNYDDILAVARPCPDNKDNKTFTRDWVREIVRMLKIPVDYSEDVHHDQLVRNGPLQICLSILNRLGFHGEFQPRSFGSKFAMLALNVRNIVILVTIASNAPMQMKTEKLSPLDEHEVVDALAGCIKWSLDLLAWLADSLFRLAQDEMFMSMISDEKTFGDATNYLRTQNDVTLHLVLCSSTRGFISAVCRRLLHMDSLSRKAIQYYENKAAMLMAQDPNSAPRAQPALYHAYQKIQTHTSGSLVKVQELDRLLSTLGHDIRGAYQAGFAAQGKQQQPAGGGQAPNDAATKRAQLVCELELLSAGSPPRTFRPVILDFFTKNLPAFREQTSPLQLFFADYSLLEVADDKASLVERRHRGLYVDVFKRVRLTAPKGVAAKKAAASTNGGGGGGGSAASSSPQWRRCVRCCAVMEEVGGPSPRPGFTFVLAQQRKCCCGGHWGLLPPGSLMH